MLSGRTLSQGATLLVLLAGLAATASAQISGDIVKIGVLSDMSSLYADIGGPGSVEAARMAIADIGGKYNFTTPGIATLTPVVLPGPYKTPNIDFTLDGVFTNKTPVGAYRGAGRPEATFLLERLVDACAHDTGLDRIEVRRKNFIPADAFPYQTPVALQYDSGNYQATLDACVKAADYAGFEARRSAAAAKGKLRGIGISTYLEACGIAPSAVVGSLGARAGLYEVANIKVHPTGSVTVYTCTHSHGQAHETTLAQLVCDRRH